MYSGGKQFPLHEAAFKDSEDAVKRVLKSGTHINCRDDLGMTALMVASLYSERVSTIELLLKHGAEIDAMDHHNQTALWHCISNDQNEIVAKLLIVKGMIDPLLHHTLFFYFYPNLLLFLILVYSLYKVLILIFVLRMVHLP